MIEFVRWLLIVAGVGILSIVLIPAFVMVSMQAASYGWYKGKDIYYKGKSHGNK